MTGMEIVREETRRMLRGMIPLAVIAFGVFLLAGADPARSAVSLLLGTCYSLLLFRMIGKSAAKAVLFPPAQGTRIVRRGYFFRYLCDGVSGNQAAVSPSARSSRSAFLSQNHFTVVHVFQRKGG